MNKIILENTEHNTKAEVQLREDIIQPGVYKEVKTHLCKCGGKCGCSEMGHHTCKCKEKEIQVAICTDTQGETYGLITNENISKE